MKTLVLMMTLLVTTITHANEAVSGNTANTSATDIPFWRTQTTEQSDAETDKLYITSSLPKETPTPAKFHPLTSARSTAANHVIWVYDADVHLLNDIDNDGYYSKLRVRFDVDTIFTHAQVFAVVYLGDDTGYREMHTTSVFDIYSDAGSDEFSFSTELLQGFIPLDYDLLIEVYDADSLTLEDEYDHTNDSDLFLVSLESNEFEQRHSNRHLSTHEHGGSSHISMLLGLLILAALRRKI